MNKARLRAVDKETPHALDIAAQRVKEFRLDRDKDEAKPLPIANQHDTGAPSLQVNEVLRRAEADLIGKK